VDQAVEPLALCDSLIRPADGIRDWLLTEKAHKLLEILVILLRPRVWIIISVILTLRKLIPCWEVFLKGAYGDIIEIILIEEVCIDVEEVASQDQTLSQLLGNLHLRDSIKLVHPICLGICPVIERLPRLIAQVKINKEAEIKAHLSRGRVVCWLSKQPTPSIFLDTSSPRESLQRRTDSVRYRASCGYHFKIIHTSPIEWI
jgi:hypothetical protein